MEEMAAHYHSSGREALYAPVVRFRITDCFPMHDSSAVGGIVEKGFLDPLLCSLLSQQDHNAVTSNSEESCFYAGVFGGSICRLFPAFYRLFHRRRPWTRSFSIVSSTFQAR